MKTTLSFDTALAVCDRTDLSYTLAAQAVIAIEAWSAYNVDDWDLDVVAAKLARGDADVVDDGVAYVVVKQEWVRRDFAEAVIAVARYAEGEGMA